MAELGLAIVGTVDLCFQWGSKLIALCNSYRHADEEIKARSIRLEMGWLKTQKQLDFMKQISGEMDEYHCSVHLRTTEQLQSHLSMAWRELNNVSEMREEHDAGMFRAFRKKSTRWKYALFKESIDDLMGELEKWQATADPTWYLLLRISNNKVDQVLSVATQSVGSGGFGSSSDPSPISSALKIRDVRRRHGSERAESGVFLPPRELDSMIIYDTPLCSAKMAQRMSARAGPQNLILTTLECPVKANVNHVAKEVRELASKLSVDDHRTFGLLSCKGVVRRVAPNAQGQQATSFTMVFRSPDNESEMSSLRSKLLSRDASVTLGDRFGFARQLAKSIAYIHTFGFVHKSVRPENVLVFPGPSPTSYLAGFDNFRKEEGRTYHQGLFEWEKNLYQHPQRQGLTPREDYVMQHDIYSLGVCLLEIGLWDSFVHYDVDGRPVTAPMLSDFARDCQSGRTSLAASKDYLVRLCEDRVPQNMGHTYYKVVKTCLTCLDPDNIDFGDEREFKDDDGILVGVRYIEKVLSRLNEISL